MPARHLSLDPAHPPISSLSSWTRHTQPGPKKAKTPMIPDQSRHNEVKRWTVGLCSAASWPTSPRLNVQQLYPGQQTLAH
ncbi:hypothetical protein E2C01_055842 [Portunus trituberculatus]|uniref:Uncharacterized protein n=1 Tax=Portunus trituberculatus TaxID=210409 RepID=A0A5B7GVU4_PORTR|nr:hypothetical protein [Portunus trituberculatus]